MAKTFRVELLPARHGDCIWIDYGDADRPNHVLIDGGPLSAYPALRRRIQSLPPGSRRFELIVVTHVDNDHIEGVLKLLNDRDLGVECDNIWFNGWHQLERPLVGTPAPVTHGGTTRAPKQGEYLELRIASRNYPWNRQFEGGAVVIPEAATLPCRRLEGGLALTLLSPTVPKLQDLRVAWDKAIRALGAEPADGSAQGRLENDRRYRGSAVAQRGETPDPLTEAELAVPKLDAAVANGSSIAFVAEFEQHRCALLGDAHMPIVQSAVAWLAREYREQRLRLDAVKLSHHGSAGNLTDTFLRRIDCRNFLVSTDGSVFGHPDDNAIAQIVRNAPAARLYFNYQSARTAQWGDDTLKQKLGYAAEFPRTEDGGIALDLLQA